jgi:catechol 2,3-dioxygenase-like lactoylglutathione lyase family enzyme
MQQQFRGVHPVIPTRDVAAAIEWYREQLGFQLLFVDDEEDPGYAGVVRDDAQIHFQWHEPKERAGCDSLQLRVFVADPDALHAEYLAQATIGPDQPVHDTGWGTREFGLYDPEMNALFFYRDLD